VRRHVVVLGALALVLSGTGTASAEPPLEVSDQVTDQAGLLGSGAAAAQQAVADLAAEDDLDLYVVLVSSFDGADAGEWAQETAETSGLEGSDVLLAVAAGESSYEYSYWVSDSFPLSEVELEDAVTEEVDTRLAAGDRSGAVVGLASRLGDLVETERQEEAASAPWSATTTLIIVGAVAVVLLAAHLLSRRRSSARSS
jgi:uncharacterized membrane protein YgcG